MIKKIKKRRIHHRSFRVASVSFARHRLSGIAARTCTRVSHFVDIDTSHCYYRLDPPESKRDVFGCRMCRIPIPSDVRKINPTDSGIYVNGLALYPCAASPMIQARYFAGIILHSR